MQATQDIGSTSLAHRLGECSHVSPLLRKVERLSGCTGEAMRQWLLKSAVTRGASHYQRPFPTELPPDNPALSDEEVGVALCLGEHPYNSALLRAAAQLLSSPRTDALRLTRLAVMERVEPILVHIALVACRVVPDAHPWATLLRKLPPRRAVPPEALPHWSRFVSQTGVTPDGGGPEIQWLWRREPK